MSLTKKYAQLHTISLSGQITESQITSTRGSFRQVPSYWLVGYWLPGVGWFAICCRCANFDMKASMQLLPTLYRT